VPSDLVGAPWAAECRIQLEVGIDDLRPFGGADVTLLAIEARVAPSHVAEELLMEGYENHIDPEGWDPLIMKVCQFYGRGTNIAPSQLAAGWRMPPLATAAATGTGRGGGSVTGPTGQMCRCRPARVGDSRPGPSGTRIPLQRCLPGLLHSARSVREPRPGRRGSGGGTVVV
jgi:hypothetical protein